MTTLPSRPGWGEHGGEDLVAAFAQWAASERVAGAARERARERWLREQAATSSTWMGTLVDLAERRAVVTVAVGDQKRSGRLVGVGRDFCVLGRDRGRPLIVAVARVSALWPDQSGWIGSGAERRPGLNLSLAGALAALADERALVALHSGSNLQYDGELVAVGEDVVTVTSRAGGSQRRVAYVPLSEVTLCELR